MAMWNVRSLKRPPVCELKVTLTYSMKDQLNRTRNQFCKAERVLESHLVTLSAEQYVLKKLIYKLSSQFRSEKSMRGLKQINNCLKRFDEVEFPSMLSEIYKLVDIYIETNDMEVYLPARRTLEYYLVRIMSVAALMAQTAHYCYNTFIHIRQHLEIGVMIPQNITLMSLIARVWYVTTSLSEKICQWYNSLYPCLSILQATPVNWLADTDVLPKDLKSWLEITLPFTVRQPDVQSEMLQTAQDDLTTCCNDGVYSVEDTDTNRHMEDIGELLVRHKEPQTKKKTKETEKEHKTNTVNSAENENAKTKKKSKTNKYEISIMKKTLRPLLKTLADVKMLNTKIRANEIFRMGDVDVKLSTMGQNKILNRLNKTTGLAYHTNDGNVKNDEILIKGNPFTSLGRMFVKYNTCHVDYSKVSVSQCNEGDDDNKLNSNNEGNSDNEIDNVDDNEINHNEMIDNEVNDSNENDEVENGNEGNVDLEADVSMDTAEPNSDDQVIDTETENSKKDWDKMLKQYSKKNDTKGENQSTKKYKTGKKNKKTQLKSMSPIKANDNVITKNVDKRDKKKTKGKRNKKPC